MFDTCDELTAACLKTLRFIICSFSYKSWMFVENIQLPELETLVYLLERIKKALQTNSVSNSRGSFFLLLE